MKTKFKIFFMNALIITITLYMLPANVYACQTVSMEPPSILLTTEVKNRLPLVQK